jgi:hypothetical protein
MNSVKSKFILFSILFFALCSSISSNECQQKLYDSCKESLKSTIYAKQFEYHVKCLRIFFKSWCKHHKYILDANIECNHDYSDICRFTSENSRTFFITHHYALATAVDCDDVSSLDSQFDNYIAQTFYDRDVVGYFYNTCYNDQGYDPNCKPAKTACVAAAKAQCLQLVDSVCAYRKGFLDLTTCNVKFDEMDSREFS